MRFCIENTPITLKTETKFRYLSIFHLSNFFYQDTKPNLFASGPTKADL